MRDDYWRFHLQSLFAHKDRVGYLRDLLRECIRCENLHESELLEFRPPARDGQTQTAPLPVSEQLIEPVVNSEEAEQREHEENDISHMNDEIVQMEVEVEFENQ
jgi:hypothetical protein